MRKRRRLADKLTIMVCAVLVAVSAFFYVPMDVSAEDYSFSGDFPLGLFNLTGSIASFDLGIVDLSKNFNINDSLIYEVKIDFDVDFVSDLPLRYMNLVFASMGSEVKPLIYKDASSWGSIYVNDFNFVHSGVYYFKGSELRNIHLSLYGTFLSQSDGSASISVDVVPSVVSLVALSESDTSDYQNGYNAGYSAGEQAGYGNGYSNGFADGEASVDTDAIYDEAFQAGKDSVDTESYYDAGYRAGYQVAYSEGYESGYDEGLKSARESKGEWGVQKKLEGDGETLSGIPFYVSTYGITDLEIFDNDAFYFYNTSPGTYHGKSEILYKMPVSSMNSPFGALVSDSGVTNVSFILPSLNLDIVVDSAGGTVSSNLVSGRLVECFVTYSGKKYYGVIGSNYVNFDFVVDEPVDQLLFSDSNFLITFVVDSSVVVVTKSDVSEYVVPKYTPKISFSDFNFFVKPYYKNDNVSANIQDQTDKLTGGFNDSKGNSVNSDFSAGLNDFETAEDSLFATATTGLKDFTFFDIQSVPAMVTGMSFVGSIMSGWFTQAGGASGVGIVLSILFSIMLVAMVLGLYRWYQSKGGKD